MSHKVRTLSRNCCGQLTYCPNCKRFHLNFNNLALEFCAREIETFRKFLNDLDVDYWESRHPCQAIQRKIPIPTLQQNLVLIFNKQELEFLKSLIFYNTKRFENLLTVSQIDYVQVLN